MGPTIRENFNLKNKEEAAQNINSAYISKVVGVLADKIERSPVETKFSYTHTALYECINQLDAVNALSKGDVTKKLYSKIDLDDIAFVNEQAIRIQKKWRYVRCINRLTKDIEIEKRRLQNRSTNREKSSEEKAVIELKQRLGKKGITPEGFFRLCDDTYTQKVPIFRFRKMLTNFKLWLSEGQIKRLCLILDEDDSGEISLEEYQNALQAYRCDEETHVITDGSDILLRFEHKSVFKLLDILA